MKTRKKRGYWTKEKCREESLKYSNRRDFNKAFTTAYQKVVRNGWGEKFFKHMNPLGNRYKRMIYAYEFPDKHVYIGLTFDLKTRNRNHLKGKKRLLSPVFKHLEKHGKTPLLIEVSKYIPVKDAQNLEKETILKYKKSGWRILNSNKAGAIGSRTSKWTKERCRKEALKYTKRRTFQIESGSAYKMAQVNKWVEEICSHMETIRNKNGFWEKEIYLKKAKECESYSAFLSQFKNSLKVMYENKWQREVKEIFIK